MAFTVAVVQFAPEKGAIEGNLDRIADAVRTASGEGADLVLLPESAVTGYDLEGGVDARSLSAADLAGRLRLRLDGLARRVDVVVGFFEAASGQPRNSAAYLAIAPGEARVLHVHRKLFLPTYGLFDEQRFHEPGSELAVVRSRLGTFGVLICEDVWHSILSVLLALRGAQAILVPVASPVRGLEEGKPGNVLRYERMLRAVAEEHGVFTAAAMLSGFEGGKALSGGSLVYDPFGTLMAQAPCGEEAILLAEFDWDTVALARSRTPLLGDLRGRWATVARLVAETRP